MDEKYAELKQAVEAADLVDAHAHNMITHASTIPFLSCFSEASGKALSFVPSTLNFKLAVSGLSPSKRAVCLLQTFTFGQLRPPPFSPLSPEEKPTGSLEPETSKGKPSFFSAFWTGVVSSY